MRQIVRQALSNVAPEADLDAIDSAKDLRDQIDIDSVDFLNFVIGLHKVLNVDIPDCRRCQADYTERLCRLLARQDRKVVRSS